MVLMKLFKQKLSHFYGEKMDHNWYKEYYQGSDFLNFGYWTKDTVNQKEASETLMENLLEFIPERKGTILDVACGLGATTRYLLKYYHPSKVTGINLFFNQLERGKTNAPDCKFLQMDAGKLGFGDSVFDSLICVEAAFHFNTREDFLREAWRVIKPGGYLVIADILVAKWAARWNPRIPERNWVKDLKEYRDLYHKVGFKDVEFVDATNECWGSFYKNLWDFRREKFVLRETNLLNYAKMNLRNYVANIGIKYYLLIAARRY